MCDRILNMNISKVIFCLMCTPAFAGFLEPSSFPTVTADMSFVDRIVLSSAGYEELDSVYDSDGNCISGCSYAMPKWEDQVAAMERWNSIIKQELIDEYDYIENDDGTINPPEYTSPEMAEIPSTTFPDAKPEKTNVMDNGNCSMRYSAFGNRTVPYGSPLGYVSCIASPYGPRHLFNRNFHYGIDLNAKTGTPVYAPASGTVISVMRGNETCGNGVIIQHADGYLTKYCHFSVVSVTQNQQVLTGCMIGRVGNTGDSTGPHLHYAVHKGGLASKYSLNPVNFIEPTHRPCK